MRKVFQAHNLYRERGIEASPESLAAVIRINALSSIISAEHGWLGATFSCADILSWLYFFKMSSDYSGKRPAGDILILSKGHAAPAQYACLAELGIIPYDDLLQYKTPDGPQAHTDILTPGIPTNTGSLGQSLSKAAGIAIADRLKKRSRKIFVILGDGELQEGQNYEALMSIAKFNISEVIPVIDRNRLQTDSPTDAIIGKFDIPKVLSAFGFNTRVFDGHSFDEINETFKNINNIAPTLFIADTLKGGGAALTTMSYDTPPGEALWHSKVPDDDEYLQILEELVPKTGSAEIINNFSCFRRDRGKNFPKRLKSGFSTRDIFAEIMLQKAENDDRIVMLDADLSKSLQLNEFQERFPERFIETGISEQDMVSIAGGLALEGFVPSVNTYASFFRRGFEQIYINATEKTFIIYAGNYSGLCYSTDGKTHQMTGDIPIMRSIPGMRVYDPFCREELEGLINYLFSESRPKNYPVYVKLRRTPSDRQLKLPHNYTFDPENGVPLKTGSDICLVAAGPHMASYALKASELSGNGCGVAAISPQNYLNPDKINKLFKNYKTLITLEEGVTAGGLGDVLSEINISKRIIRKGVNNFTFSARNKEDIYKRFNLDPESLSETLRSISEMSAEF